MIRRLAHVSCMMAAVACTPYSVAHTNTPPVAAFGPSPAGVGTVCVIRPAVLAGAVTLVVHDNEQLVGATKGASYFCYVAAPGHHQLVSDTFDSTDRPGRFTLAVSAGQRYWVYQDHDNHFGSITSKLSTVDEARARDLIASCEYAVVTDVPAHEHVPAEVPFAPPAAW